MNTFTLGLVVIIYLLAIAYLGYKGYSKTKSASDYMLAGREIHPFVMAMSYGATFISTSAIIGFGGMAGVYGMGLIWLTELKLYCWRIYRVYLFGRKTRRWGTTWTPHFP
jgi:SSS family solute:Na+ symporter